MLQVTETLLLKSMCQTCSLPITAGRLQIENCLGFHPAGKGHLSIPLPSPNWAPAPTSDAPVGASHQRGGWIPLLTKVCTLGRMGSDLDTEPATEPVSTHMSLQALQEEWSWVQGREHYHQSAQPCQFWEGAGSALCCGTNPSPLLSH